MARQAAAASSAPTDVVSFVSDAPGAAADSQKKQHQWAPDDAGMDPERVALLATVECDAHESFDFIHANMTCARSVPYWLDTYYWAYVLILGIGVVPVPPTHTT